jgi:hypothetical protein
VSDKIFRRCAIGFAVIATPTIYSTYVVMAKTFVAGVVMQVLGPLLGGH